MNHVAKKKPTAAPWIAYHRPPARPRMRLFCLPYAGGTAALYRGWQKLLGDDVEVCPIQPPGREGRLTEPGFKDVDALADVLTTVLTTVLADGLAPAQCCWAIEQAAEIPALHTSDKRAQIMSSSLDSTPPLAQSSWCALQPLPVVWQS